MKLLDLGLALIGTKFMGKAHANASQQAWAFFSLGLESRLAWPVARTSTKPKTSPTRSGLLEPRPLGGAASASEVDLVDISTPNDLHAPVAQLAARNEKTVFYDKPLAPDLAQARQMLRAVREAGVPHMICFNYRYFPALQLAKKLIRDGALGEVR